MKYIRLALVFVLILYLMLLVRLIIFKLPDAWIEQTLRAWSPEGALRGLASANIIPFRNIRDSLFNPTLPVQLPTLMYNIAAFVPLGFLVPLISERARRLAIVLIVAFGISVSLELIQVVTLLVLGDIDDVILNVTGTAIGYGIFALAVWLRQYFRQSFVVSKRTGQSSN